MTHPTSASLKRSSLYSTTGRLVSTVRSVPLTVWQETRQIEVIKSYQKKRIFKPEKVDIRTHPEIREKVIQDIIADDPKILGSGDLFLKDKQRLHPRSGRLDLLMQDADTLKRYEIEIQLGKTDASHIVRNGIIGAPAWSRSRPNGGMLRSGFRHRSGLKGAFERLKITIYPKNNL